MLHYKQSDVFVEEKNPLSHTSQYLFHCIKKKIRILINLIYLNYVLSLHNPQFTPQD